MMLERFYFGICLSAMLCLSNVPVIMKEDSISDFGIGGEVFIFNYTE